MIAYLFLLKLSSNLPNIIWSVGLNVAVFAHKLVKPGMALDFGMCFK